MLLRRIMTAVPLALFVVWVILFQPTEVVKYLLFLVALLAAFEWVRLANYRSKFIRASYAALVVAVSWWCMEALYELSKWVVYLSTFWWFGVVFYLFKASPVETKKSSMVKLLIGVLVIPAAIVAMYKLHQASGGGDWLLYALTLVWVADTGAYFSGKKFGRHKLAPKVSPGKTLEGLYGALAANVIYSISATFYFGLYGIDILYFVLLSILVTVVSVAGDLYESVLKRESGVKDSGMLLPGHGGMLDRIDGVLSAVPVFVFGISLLFVPLQW